MVGAGVGSAAAGTARSAEGVAPGSGFAGLSDVACSACLGVSVGDKAAGSAGTGAGASVVLVGSGTSGAGAGAAVAVSGVWVGTVAI
jgi:hypothetical protein